MIFTPEQLAEVKAYAFPHYVWMATGDVVMLGVYLALLRFAMPPLYALAERTAARVHPKGSLRRASERLWGGPGLGRALLFTLFYFVAFELAALPATIYFGYYLEKLHGESNYTPLSFSWDLAKTTLTGAIALAALTLGMYGLARRLKWWWLVLGVVAALATLGAAVLDPYRGQLYFQQTPLPSGPLRTRLDAELRRAGVEYGDIVVEKTSRATKKVDVYCAGQGKSRRVVITDAFLAQFPEREIGVAVAHEAGHVRESRLWNAAGAGLALVAFLFLVDRLLRVSAARHWLGIAELADIRTLPMLVIAFFVLARVATPLAAAFSRERERAADRFALELTQDPEAFESMLIRAARINKTDPDPPGWVVWLGSSHPPISERLAWVRDPRRSSPPRLP